MKSVYLALGDSMSIDEYTGVIGGGAASQFHKRLGESWSFRDLTVDGCTIGNVPRGEKGDVITLTIGGNDALLYLDEVINQGVETPLDDHLDLLIDHLENPNRLRGGGKYILIPDNKRDEGITPIPKSQLNDYIASLEDDPTLEYGSTPEGTKPR